MKDMMRDDLMSRPKTWTLRDVFAIPGMTEAARKDLWLPKPVCCNQQTTVIRLTSDRPKQAMFRRWMH